MSSRARIHHSPRMSLAPYPVQPVTDDVVATASRYPDEVALICGATGARYTYAELVSAARRLGLAMNASAPGGQVEPRELRQPLVVRGERAVEVAEDVRLVAFLVQAGGLDVDPGVRTRRRGLESSPRSDRKAAAD